MMLGSPCSPCCDCPYPSAGWPDQITATISGATGGFSIANGTYTLPIQTDFELENRCRNLYWEVPFSGAPSLDASLHVQEMIFLIEGAPNACCNGAASLVQASLIVFIYPNGFSAGAIPFGAIMFEGKRYSEDGPAMNLLPALGQPDASKFGFYDDFSLVAEGYNYNGATLSGASLPITLSLSFANPLP